MSDPAENLPNPETPTPPPAAAANAAEESETKRAPRTRCALTRKQQNLAERGRLVSRAAQKAAYVPVLDANGLLPAVPGQLLAKILEAEAKGSGALGHGMDGMACTVEEGDSKTALVQDLRSFQKAARQSYETTQPTKLAEYLIGQRIAQSREALEDNAVTIIDKTDADRPGSVNTEMITAAEVKLTKYNQDHQTQGNEKQLSEEERGQRDDKFVVILELTRQIQLAADRAWPFNVKGNAAKRKEFLLPLRRPFAN